MNTIFLHVKPYRGSDWKRRAQFQSDCEAAKTLERFLNEQRAKGKPQSFTYSDIARRLGLESDTVARVLSSNGGGNTGITI